MVVKFHEPKIDVTEDALGAPIDPTECVTIQNSGGMAFGLNADGIRLTFSAGSIRTMFQIDNQMVLPNALPPPMPLPQIPQGKARHGFTSEFSCANNNRFHITPGHRGRSDQAREAR